MKAPVNVMEETEKSEGIPSTRRNIAPPAPVLAASTFARRRASVSGLVVAAAEQSANVVVVEEEPRVKEEFSEIVMAIAPPFPSLQEQLEKEAEAIVREYLEGRVI